MSVSLYGSGQTVIQVVQGTATTNTTTTSGTYVTTGLSASITPQSTTSKILVLASPMVYCNNSNNNILLTIYRGSTNLGTGTYTYPSLAWSNFNNSSSGLSLDVNYLDSPSTTSSTTYTVYFLSSGGGTVGINQYSVPSTITLLEISGS